MDIGKSLTDEIRRRDARVAELERQRSEISEKIRTLQAEQRVLKGWLKNTPDFLTQASSNGAVKDGPTPTEGVDELVDQKPGITRADLIDELETVVASDSANVRSILSSTVSRRIREKKMWQDREERLWPWDHPRAVEGREVLDMMDQT